MSVRMLAAVSLASLIAMPALAQSTDHVGHASKPGAQFVEFGTTTFESGHKGPAGTEFTRRVPAAFEKLLKLKKSFRVQTIESSKDRALK